MKSLLGASLLFCLGWGAVANAADATKNQVPGGLEKKLKDDFSYLTLPGKAWNAAGPFYWAVQADFNGDGRSDSAVLMLDRAKDEPHLVVALAKGDGWSTSMLPLFCQSLASCYVDVAKPGKYARTTAVADSPVSLRSDEVQQIVSKTSAVVSGVRESTAVVYAYTGQGWKYVMTQN